MFGRRKRVNPGDGRIGPATRAATGNGPLGKRWEVLCDMIGLDPEAAAPHDVIRVLRDRERCSVTGLVEARRRG